MFKNMNTNSMISITGSVGAISWIGTIAFGFLMYEYFSLGILTVLISMGWLVVICGTVAYIEHKSDSEITRMTVWKVWLILSVLGCVVNIVAGGMLELNIMVDQSVDPIDTLPMEYGVILPWLIIYSIGYLFTSLYNISNKSLSNNERVVYGFLGVLSIILSVFLGMNPGLHTPMILALTGITILQMITVLLRD